MKYLKLKFLLMFFALAMAIPPAWAAEVTDVIDYSVTAEPLNDYNSSQWNSFTVTGQSGAEYLIRSMGGVTEDVAIRWNGKSNSYMYTTKSAGTLKSIKVYGDASESRFLNVFAQNTAFSDPPAAGGNVTGTITTLKILSSGNEYVFTNNFAYLGLSGRASGTLVTKIEITWVVPDAGAPVLTVNPGSLSITDADGDHTYGTITATVENTTNPITYEATTGWSANLDENRVYYNAKALSANGTVTYKCEGASSVPVNVEYNYTGPLYILGTVNNGGWAPNNYVQMTKGDDGLYTAEVTASEISFTKRVAEYSDQGSWDYIYNYRFVPVSNGTWGLNDNTIGKFCDLDFEPSHVDNQKIVMEYGTYTVTINPETNQFKITKVLAPVTYEKVTSTEDVTDGNYLIVYEMGATGFALDGSLETLDETGNTQLVEIENDKITTSDAIYFTYDATAKTLKSASGVFIGHTGTKNTLNQSATAGEGYYNNISFDSDGNALIVIPNDNYELKYNKTSGQDRFRYFSSGNSQQAIQLYKEYNPNKVATPKFTPAGDTYTEAQNVTISCATDGATIYYSTDGSNWIQGNTVNVTESCTLYAKATKTGMDDSSIATAVYTINLPASVSSIAAVNALDPGKDFVFNNKAVVVHRKGNQMWIQDYEPTAGGALVYGDGLAYNDNDVLKTGWTGTTATYNGKKEIINLVAVTDGTKEAKAMKRTTLSENNINEYVLLENVTLEIVDNDTIITLPDSRGNVKVYDNFKKLNDFTIKEGFNYNVKGIVDVYKKNNTSTLEIYPLNIELVKKDLTLGFDPATVDPYVGQAFTAPTLTGVPEGETIDVTYSSNNTNVATVVDNVVTLVEGATGTAIITATFAGNDYYNPTTATYTITVKPKEAAGLSYGEEPVVVNVTYPATGVELPTLSNPNSLAVTYTTSDDKVATVAADGTVTIVGAGTAEITASTDGNTSHNSGTASYTIVVAQADATVTFPEPKAYTVYPEDDFTAPVPSVTPDGLTPTYSIAGNENEIVLFDESDGTVVIGKNTGTVTITATVGGEGTNYKLASDSYTLTVEPKPYMMAEPTSLDFVTVIGNDPVSKTFTVMADNLKGDITLTMTESNVFTITPATIAKADMTEEGVEVTVTYTPKAATGEDFDEATVTIKSTDADDVKVNLRGMATLPDPELTVTPGTLEMGTNPTGTFTVTGQHLTEDVTLTVTEGTAANFVITPATITPDEEGKVNQEITVTYKGNNTEDEYATITVKSGIAKKEVIVTARVLPTPELIADPESLTMTAVVGQTPATATFTVMAEDLRGDITLTLSETDAFTINPATIAKANMTEDGVEVTVTYTPTQAGNDNATITIASEAAESVTVTLNGTATVPEVVAAPTFSLVAGTYGEAQQLTISAENGANILYSTDGSEPTTPYNGAISLGEGTTTVKAVATKDGFANSPVVTATYIIDIPEELPTITPFKGYYQIKNNGNGMYANIAGRKTLNFTDAENAKKMAGTVIWLETNDKGQVQSIRSQAADLQGYANRAMRYVPQMVDIVVNKINQMEGIEDATGAGSVLGENGLEEIMAKFNECFDYHLYVEEAQGGWRLYGKTPNMQHVVDFYRDHKDQVEAKLPKLEKFINDALHKLINKIGGSTVFTDFSLHKIWEKMGGNLPEPVVGDDAAIMDFYRAVLNNKNYVWDFAYQTAQIYWGNVKSHPRYEELKAQLGEYADYIDEFVTQVRPDFKYYVIQRGDEPDYISEGNGEIISNQPHTLWTLDPRTDFTVNISGEQFGCPYAGGLGGYATTNYTDFAYTVPEGVTAYKVASVENGVANLQALSGVIPAQTPVLLMAKEAKDYVLTLSTEAGTKVTGNLLVGVDSLITRFQLKTPMVESLFSLAKGVLGEQLYNQYVAQYEYLQLLYAGTVNNKYFWGLSQDNVEKCVYTNEENTQDCVIRNLGNGEFVNDWKSPKTNKAFLVSETDQTITISTLRGDVNHDGLVNIEDVTDLIDRLLGMPDAYHLKACEYCSDVNKNGTVKIDDVTTLIDILLGIDGSNQATDPQGGE